VPDEGQPQDVAQPVVTVPARGRRPPKMGKVRTPAPTPRRLSELQPGERRRAVLCTVVIITVFWSGFVALYYVVPAASDGAAGAFPRLAVGLLLFAALLAWNNSRIGRAELPELRAARSLGSVIPLFLTVFATIYLALSHTSAANFNQRLDHTGALYFTITIFSTVGFGDITPITDSARIMVAIQMLLDLVIIGLVVRLVLNTAKTSLVRADQSPADSP
jgi:voltage-gated potassium channel